ncbi:MAG: hypothetical protein ACREQY_22700, partial [Candidatus Binatia bacterium]
MNEILRVAVAAAIVAGALRVPAASADDRVLLLSAYPTEQAKLLAQAKSEGEPVTPVDVFNRRRFFTGTIGGRKVVFGLTGIGMTDAERTTADALQRLPGHSINVIGIVFSGVAGGPNIGDVVIPERWSDGTEEYDVDPGMYAVAESLDVELDPYLPVEDAACTGEHFDALRTPIRVEVDPQIRPGGVGASSDPYGGRAVPCLSSAGSLLGCEACGAPVNTSPDVEGFISDAAPFFDPQFFQDLFESFAPSEGSDAVVQDMETAAVARVAAANEIPFIAFRAVSDGGGDPNPVSALLGFPFQFFIYQQLAADNAA